MKRLLIIRHAKSSWDDPLSDDHARILNGRGRAAAKAMGAWLRAQEHRPDLALVSDAARTQETFERLGLGCEHIALPALYHASSDRILHILQEKGGSAECLAVIAHNPGIGDFAGRLVADRPDHPRFADYPTCAALIAECDITDWRELEFGCGSAIAFRIPADL